MKNRFGTFLLFLTLPFCLIVRLREITTEFSTVYLGTPLGVPNLLLDVLIDLHLLMALMGAWRQISLGQRSRSALAAVMAELPTGQCWTAAGHSRHAGEHHPFQFTPTKPYGPGNSSAELVWKQRQEALQPFRGKLLPLQAASFTLESHRIQLSKLTQADGPNSPCIGHLMGSRDVAARVVLTQGHSARPRHT